MCFAMIDKHVTNVLDCDVCGAGFFALHAGAFGGRVVVKKQEHRLVYIFDIVNTTNTRASHYVIKPLSNRPIFHHF